jgi:ligand-binding sensor domain-containing protein/signal transduction histidine kinase
MLNFQAIASSLCLNALFSFFPIFSAMILPILPAFRRYCRFSFALLCASAFLTCSRVGFGQEAQNIVFERLTVQAGLSQGSIWCITQDQRGFMWFGTEDGLNRYDGSTFKIFRSDSRDTSSIPGNYIENLYVDKEGVLWVCTKQGLCRYDRFTEKFFAVPVESGENSLPAKYVTSVVDDARGEHLWIGTYGGGLAKMNKKTGAMRIFRKQTANGEGLQSDIVWRLAADRSGGVWAATYDGGVYYISSDDQFRRFTPESDEVSWRGNDIQAIHVDRQNIVWIGTNKSGLWRCEPRLLSRTGTFTHYPHDPSNPKTIAGSHITAILKAQSGLVWVGTNNGLSMFDQINETASNFRKERGEETSLLDNNVLSLYEDRSGIIWVGTVEGVSFFNPKAQKFLTYRVQNVKPLQSLSSNVVWAFAEDKQGNIWVGTEEGLNRMNSKPLAGGLGDFTAFRKNPNLPFQFEDDFITALCVSRDGALWIGTEQSGVYILRQTDVYGKANFEHYVAGEGARDLPSNSVSKIIEDRSGGVWIATARGVARVEGVSPDRLECAVYRKGEDNADGSLASDIVFTLLEDRAGTIWIGTENGLTALDARTGKTQTYRAKRGDGRSLSNDAVQHIVEDASGRLWIATESGLNFFDRQSGSLGLLELSGDGIEKAAARALKGTILAVQEDRGGALWITTHSGLVRYDAKANLARLFDERDGLQGRDFITGAAFTSSSGAIFFGGVKGFSVFHPDSFRARTPTFPVVLGDITKNDAPFPREYLDTVITEKRYLELPHNENTFEIQFAALGYVYSERNRFRFKLKGFDKEWQYAEGKRGQERYKNLPPGEYKLVVQVPLADGSWGDEETKLFISITPPFWEKLWFKIISAAFAIALVFGGIRWRLSAIERRNQELQKLVDQRTKELQDSNEEIKTQMKEIERQNAILDRQAADIELKNTELQEAYSALKESEEQRAMERARLAQSEKMASIGRLTNSVAHEINNPVNFISGAVKPLRRNIEVLNNLLRQYAAFSSEAITSANLHALRRQIQEIEEYKEEVQLETRLKQVSDLLENISVGSERIAEIVRSLRTLNRPEEEALKLASLHEGIDATIRLLYNQSKYPKIRIIKDYGENVPDILCFPGPVNQVFMNILHNAIQAIGEDGSGEIRIATSTQANNPKNVVVSIRDTGRGMNAETLAKIFDPGFTTKQDGMGIGLAISKDIIETKHKGSISVWSEPGVGSEFTIVLPVDGPQSVSS